jgi:hypothetical protein
MDVGKVLQGSVPVVVGIFIAGYLMNALRANTVVDSAIKGYN